MFVFTLIALIVIGGLASLPWASTTVILPIVLAALVLGLVLFILRSGGGFTGGGRREHM